MKKILSLFIALLPIAFFLLAGNAFAASCPTGQIPDGSGGCKSAYDGTNGGASGGTVTLNPPAGMDGLNPQQMIGRIINSALGIVGSLALLMFIYGGFVWLTSAGSADKVTKGKNILVWATIGLAVIFMSYGATQFILEKVTGTK